MWEHLLKPLLFLLPPERAHYFSMGAFQFSHAVPGMASILERQCRVEDLRLVSDVCGLKFPNPVGLAAGFDKDARWYHLFDRLGFGAVEIGSITGQGQPGNPKPRLFRLPMDQALINRMGFNNQGADFAAENLGRRDDRRFRSRALLGINLGKTKIVPLENAADDYAHSFQQLFPFADYFVINVSSPNTPGLRELQDKKPLLNLLGQLHQWNQQLSEKHQASTRPVFIKIAPDVSSEQLNDICEIVQGPHVDGIIATNTTISRDGLRTKTGQVQAIGAGGLSGKPLFEKSLNTVREIFRNVGRAKPIIAVGGIFNGDDAWRMIISGASLVQIYTGFIYGGPFTVRRINQRLLDLMSQHGLQNIAEAIGNGDLSLTRK
ncbi:MAG: quinone-dependent dihydroorotate dehydrogenase [Pirellulaceae bacterium]